MPTGIEYCDETWSPTTGCSRVSPGCTNCWALAMAKRFGWPQEVVLHPDRLNQPLDWKKPRSVLTCSMGDLFHDDVSDAYIGAVFGIMKTCQRHRFLVLTKRVERMAEWVKESGARIPRRWWMEEALDRYWPSELGRAPCMVPEIGWPLRNVWLGATVENQEEADKRIPILSQIPAFHRWLSVEPMLTRVEIQPSFFTRVEHRETRMGNTPLEFQDVTYSGVDWIVAGCESGPYRRPCELDWIRDLRDQCVAADVPCFIKQADIDGKVVKMPEIDGVVWNQLPE